MLTKIISRFFVRFQLDNMPLCGLSSYYQHIHTMAYSISKLQSVHHQYHWGIYSHRYVFASALFGLLSRRSWTSYFGCIEPVHVFPGYMVASLVVRDNLHYIYLCISYGLIGCATSCLYFSSLLTCAKVFPTTSR